MWMAWMRLQHKFPTFEGHKAVTVFTCVPGFLAPRTCADKHYVDSAATVSDVHVHSRWKCCCTYRLFNDVVSSVDVGWLKDNELERLWKTQSWPDVRCCQGIHCKEMRNATKYVTHGSWSRPTLEPRTSRTKFRNAVHFSHRYVPLTT